MVKIFGGDAMFTIPRSFHILDANRKCMVVEGRELFTSATDVDVRRYIGDQDIFRSATQLSEAGIRFYLFPAGYLIGFSDGGWLRISPLTVDDTTETMLLNLIALEQYQVGSTGGRNEVNSYIFFMNRIIYDARDVSLLCSRGIIKNRMGNDEAVVKLFKSLAKGTTLYPETRAGKVYCLVAKYYQTRRIHDNPADSLTDEFKNLGEMPTTTVDVQTETEEWKKRSIYKVAPHVTEVNNKAYKPQVVSFGPYHHGEEHLRPMEEHKRRALTHFLRRSHKPLWIFQSSLHVVTEDMLESYESLDPVWKQNYDAFLQMMILDGCFMLEILRAGTGAVDDYAPNDPIFSNHGKVYIMPFFKHDMLVLENQLPLLVLYKLLAVEKDMEIEEYKDVNELILKFFGVPYTRSASMGKCLHVLDVYRKSMVWEDSQRNSYRTTSSPKAPGDNKPIQEEQIILSATRLSEAGILFKRSRYENLTDMSFDHGALKLPHVVVDDTTESMFLNQIAFERYHVEAGDKVSSYIFFMNSIIYNAKDVSLLHSRGIIRNALGNEEAVVKLFNLLAKDITLDPKNMVHDINRKVDAYCKKPWILWRAEIVHTYITSPWPILFAANLLFVFSIIQTVYTIYGVYYKK